MNDATRHILVTLKDRGYRITQARREVCAVLAETATPLTTQEIVSETAANEASVYRTIRLLQHEKLLEDIITKDDAPRYSFRTSHHHHAVCRDCGIVSHLPCSPEPCTPRRVPGFARIESHDLTFYGRCCACSSAS